MTYIDHCPLGHQILDMDSSDIPTKNGINLRNIVWLKKGQVVYLSRSSSNRSGPTQSVSSLVHFQQPKTQFEQPELKRVCSIKNLRSGQ